MFPSERGDKEHCRFKERRKFFTCFGKSLIFQLLPFVFDSRHGSTESFIWLLRLKMRRSIIHGHPKAIVGKLRKDLIHNMRAVVIDEARLAVEWKVFDICLELFPFTAA